MSQVATVDTMKEDEGVVGDGDDAKKRERAVEEERGFYAHAEAMAGCCGNMGPHESRRKPGPYARLARPSTP